MQLQSKTEKLTVSAVFIALALALSLLDSAICSFLPFVPGMKIGLAGGVTLFALNILEKKYVFLIVAVRCVLSIVFFGSPTMLLFSLSGAMLSLLVMIVFQKYLSLIKVSILGAISHNAAQIAVAMIITGSVSVSWYFPVLICTGAISGFFMGWLVSVLLQRVPLQHPLK